MSSLNHLDKIYRIDAYIRRDIIDRVNRIGVSLVIDKISISQAPVAMNIKLDIDADINIYIISRKSISRDLCIDNSLVRYDI